MQKKLKTLAFLAQYFTRKLAFVFKRRLPGLKRVYFNAFPATHLKKMDVWDYFFSFSGELLIVLIVITVAGFNLFYFSLQKSGYQDKSFAAKLLSYHPAANQKLAARNNAIKTTIASQNLFVPEAYADYQQSLEADSTSAPIDDPDQDFVISDTSMVRPNPDSIQNLINKQIKVYQTLPGDTLAKLSQEFGISTETIIWANKLPNASLKPGWQLLILPTNGVLVQADSNTTLPDIAKKYKGDLDRIISYNGLASAEDIDTGQLIIVPDGRVPSPPSPKPKSRTPQPSPSERSRTYAGDNHLFPWGYCTWYVATRVRVPWGGNAKNWLANAHAYGAVITREAVAGSIVITTDNRRYGHSAYVESVDEESFVVSEMNYERFGRVNTRRIAKNDSRIRGFILP